MFKFGIKNFRRLSEVGPIEIKPITFLVGRNSSGKSSFLRTFPLLRQSVMTRTSAPILWYGDLVDFGSFQGSVFCNDISKDISFSFGLPSIQTSWHFYSRAGRYISPSSMRKYEDVSIEYSIQYADEKTRVSRISLSVGSADLIANIELGTAGDIVTLSINGENRIKEFSGTPVFGVGSFFPSFYVRSPSAAKETSPVFSGVPEIVNNKLAEKIKRFLGDDVEPEDIYRICDYLLSHQGGEDLFDQKIDTRSRQFLFRKFQSLGETERKSIREETKKLSLLYHLFPMLESASEAFERYLDGTLYIGPARARSERYYRYQDLAVSEINPDGKNFPMFLLSLTSKQFEGLSSWIERLYGYRLHLGRSSGHISIEIGDSYGKTNVVDTGYGVSQILPVLGQIWWAENGTHRNVALPESRPSLVAIEQPELHLHPAHQALLADALAEVVAQASSRKNSTPIHYMIETHSESLINKVGELIFQKRINHEDVQILIFEPHKEDRRATSVRVAKYQEDGQLSDWPYGFFQPD